MAIRGRREWLTSAQPKGFEVRTSEGSDRVAGNHTRPNWVDMGGTIEDAWIGVTVLGHPDNFRFPQPVRLHPSKPYFCFAPQVLGEFKIAPQTTYASSYRFLTYTGRISDERSRRLWHDLEEPPEIEVRLN